MIAAGSCKGGALWRDVMEWAMWSGEVRMQDISYPLSTLGSGGNGDRCFAYFKQNHSRIRDKFKGGLWGGVVALSCRGSDISNVVEYWKDKDIGGAKRRLDQAIEAGVIRRERVKRDREALKGFWG